MIAWDTETRSLRWWENPGFLASWDEGSGAQVAPLTHAPSRPQLVKKLLAHEELTGANTKFDAHVTREATGHDVYKSHDALNIHDVNMQHRLLYGSRKSQHGLDEQTVDLIDKDAMKGEALMEAKYEKLSGRASMKHDDAYWDVYNADEEGRNAVIQYAGEDASHTLILDGMHRPRIKEDPKLHDLYQLEQRVSEVLYRAEQRGVRIDPEAVARLDSHYREREASARNDCQAALGGVPEGEGSEEWLREQLPRVGVKLTERTKTGQIAVNKQALEKFSDHPAVKALFEFRRVRKFQTTYIEAIAGREHVHPDVQQAEAWTGRMAYKRPNLQNLPKRSEMTTDDNLKIRSAFVPRKGMEFVIVDFESIEMRILAHFLGIPSYQDEVANGDPHAKTAFAGAQVLGLGGSGPEDFGKLTPNRPVRDGAKQGTYSIVYGAGAPTFTDTWNREMRKANRPDLIIDIDQGRQVKKAIVNSIPGFKAFTQSPFKGKSYPKGTLYQQLERSMVFEQTDEGQKAYGYVRTIGGRMQWIKLEKAYVALSGLVQGSAADIMKKAAVNVFDAMAPHGAYPLLFVHDELVVECEKGQGKDLLPTIREAMIDNYAMNPGLEVEAHITDKSYAHAD